MSMKICFMSLSVHQGIVHLVISLLTHTIYSHNEGTFGVFRLSKLCEESGSSFGLIGGVMQTEICRCTWLFLMDLDRE